MSWQYKVVKKVTLENNIPTDITYEIHDVYLDENLDIVYVGRLSFPVSDNVQSLQWSLERMMEACSKPVIDYNTGEEVNEEKD
jgi:hypothetical protein